MWTEVVIGVGLDIVEIVRIERLLERYGGQFVGKLMGPVEAAGLPPAGAERTLAVALAVAGKEAASKAIGTGWSRGVFWRDVVVQRTPAPAVRLSGEAAAVARRLGSSGRTRTRLELRGPLAVGEVWLLP
jgi:holo-[acyl-carrier protein] synthase